MLERRRHLDSLQDLLGQFPVVALLGARQVGKTTLARRLLEQRLDTTTAFDLEDPVDLERLTNPKLALEPLEGLVLIDEVQRRPDLFQILRVLVDRPSSSARFLVLGSASPDLLKQSSETLAGRIAYYELPPFCLDEVGLDNLSSLWLRGGFPLSYLAADDSLSYRWRQSFIRTFLERDLPELGVSVPATTMRRFWTMVAHYHGDRWNHAEISRALAVTAPTIRGYLDALTDSLVVRQLQPWFENIKKRQVRAPKVYVTDSGVLHSLLGLASHEEVARHPKIGASWEGFAMQEVVRVIDVGWENCYYWATHTGAELDLLVFKGSRRLGFEFKLADAPRTTRSMHSALSDLSLDRLFVVYPGPSSFMLTDQIQAVGLKTLEKDLQD